MSAGMHPSLASMDRRTLRSWERQQKIKNPTEHTVPRAEEILGTQLHSSTALNPKP